MTHKSARWYFNIKTWNPSYNDILLSTSCIQQEEKDRLIRFVFKDDFKSSLIGRLMMRKFIHSVSHYPYNEIHFFRDDRGKPKLAKPRELIDVSFNVSHQGDYVVFAGETNTNVLGVDVMKLSYDGGKSVGEFFRLMMKHFSPMEWLTIKSRMSESQQVDMFCRHWSLKESYVKAIGVGITVNLQDIDFRINTKDLRKLAIVADTELYVENEKQPWIFEEMLLDDKHCVSVALEKRFVESNLERKNVFEVMTFQELVDGAIPLLGADNDYVQKYFGKMDKV